jgi:hypothetical protein
MQLFAAFERFAGISDVTFFVHTLVDLRVRADGEGRRTTENEKMA